ncbi:HD domain-containing protein [Staphylococcus chromogenes]|nr:HD domain-containing protein [Staphylococcus chromogenes]
MLKEQLVKAKNYMEHFHQADVTGHDIAHIRRVVAMAKLIAQDYPEANIFVIEMAALLHDTIDDKLTESNARTELLSFLTNIQVSSQDQQHILYIIDHMSFRKSQTLSTIEGQIVQDADRLDALGAIGIARTFQFAGHFNETMWTGNVSERALNHIDITTLPPSAIKHFYEKLLKLKDLMNTPKAKAIAQERHTFLKQFLSQFFKEWVE